MLSPDQVIAIEERLLQERNRAFRILERLRQQAESPRDGSRADPWSNHGADYAAEQVERETASWLESREGRYLDRLEDALRRLYEGPTTFGRCQACGGGIPFPRLEIVPYARYCLECKRTEEAA